jgi:hypothetical protein
MQRVIFSLWKNLGDISSSYESFIMKENQLTIRCYGNIRFNSMSARLPCLDKSWHGVFWSEASGPSMGNIVDMFAVWHNDLL